MTVKELINIMDDCYIIISDVENEIDYSLFSAEKINYEPYDSTFIVVPSFEQFENREVDFACINGEYIFGIVLKGE